MLTGRVGIRSRLNSGEADTPWFQSLLTFDPAKVVEDVRQPMLFVHGASIASRFRSSTSSDCRILRARRASRSRSKWSSFVA